MPCPVSKASASFGAIAVKVEERALLSSILLNRKVGLTNPAAPYLPARWQTPAWGRSAKSPTYLLPSEIQGNPAGSQILADYNELLAKADRLRHCTARDEKAKAAVSAIDAYAVAINSVSDKAPVAPLALAIQQESLFSNGAPKILRVSVEQSGGTSRTSSGIWYTLGFPGAATVSAGLLVSFRLIDTSTGKTEMSGIVRCAVPYASLRSIKHFAKPELKTGEQGVPPRKATCSYIAG